ncbi:MAG: hypothetical protein HC880_21305 [Bacteroidia bacterium]|nr:hypothetical protein [Bacteroidia bacterium]
MKLGPKLKNGNGKIYGLKKYPKRLVKIDETLDLDDRRFLMKVIRYIKKNKNKAVVNLYEHGVLAGGAHYYVMDKLSPLKDKWNRGDRLASYLYGGTIPPTETPQLVSFVKEARKLLDKYEYGDIHGGNIMLDADGNYKFVDLESFTYV